jgi:hypothetical protein
LKTKATFQLATIKKIQLSLSQTITWTTVSSNSIIDGASPLTWFSQTQEIDFKESLKKRATTTHYDHDRGEKYEVEWTDEQKFPHVADRLGYPILREEPIERIFGIERAPAHPGY